MNQLRFAIVVTITACAASSLWAAPISRVAVTGHPQITDGDTLRIGNDRIRLFGIDAPEIRQNCNDDRGARYACGEAARDALRRYVSDTQVTCEPVDRDRYGRTVARCYAHGEDLNGWLVANGWAVAYRQFSGDYVQAEEHAHAQHLGLWRGEFMLPSQWRAQRR